MEKPSLIRFMALACYYAQGHINPDWYDEDADRQLMLECTSHQMACFLAQNTVLGGDGVETEVVLEQLLDPPVREVEEWEGILAGLVEDLGGFKSEEPPFEVQRCNHCMAVFDEELYECPDCGKDDALMYPFTPSTSDVKFTERKSMEEKLIDVFVQVLNEAYDSDPGAIHALLCNRVPCNDLLASHPAIQVELNKVARNEGYIVGMLGILNGVCERITGERVAAVFEGDPPQLQGFTKYKKG